jgi:elongation factor G
MKPVDSSETPEGVDEYRKKLIEKAAESDDSVLEKYLEGGELTPEELRAGLRRGSLEGKYIPVLCGSAVKNIGTSLLLNAIALCLASPIDMSEINPIKGKNPKSDNSVERKPDPKEPLSLFVFKTIADPFAGKLSLFRVYSGTLRADSTVLNSVTGAKERIGQVFYLLGKKQVPTQSVGPGEIAVCAKLKETNTGDTLCDEANPIVLERVKFSEPMISYAIEPKSRGDEEKVSSALHRILDEDPTLRFHRDEETKEMLLSGMGQMHLETIDVDDPFPGLAKRLTDNTLWGSSTRRARLNVALAKQLKVDGVVHFNHWGCRHGLGSVPVIRNAFTEAGIPFLAIDGDALGRGGPQQEKSMQALESFLEIL